MKTVLFTASLILALGASFVMLGFCMPVEQKSELSKEFDCNASTLWNQLISIEDYPSFKSDVSQIELHAKEPNLKWTEFNSLGVAETYEVIERIPNKKLVVKVFDPSLNIEKTREYNIFENGSASILSIKEYRKIEKLLLRSTLAISGQSHSIKKELNSLAQHMSL